MLATLKAESGLNPKSQGWNCHYGKISKACKKEDRHKAWSVDCGIAQINVIGKVCPSEMFDIDHNLGIALKKYKARGKQPWYGYTRGAYKAHLSWAKEQLAISKRTLAVN